MNNEIETKIGEIFDRNKQLLIEEINSEAAPVIELFEVFIKLLNAQEKEYSQLFEVPGFLPKQFERPVGKLLGNFIDDRYLFDRSDVNQLYTLLEIARHLEAAFNGNPPVFMQQKLTVNGKMYSAYTVENFAYEWAAKEAFFPGASMKFPSLKVENETTAELKVKRIPLNHGMLLSLLSKLPDEDCWEIQETDPIEHYEERVFLWDKAFGSLFENAQQ